MGDHRGIAGLLIYRFDSPLFLANVSVMTEELSDLVATAKPLYDWILIDAEGIYNIDTTAVQGLEELIDDLHAANIVFALARLR